MPERSYVNFLATVREEAARLNAGSDRVAIVSRDPSGAQLDVSLHCRTLVRCPDGRLTPTDEDVRVGLCFPPSHLHLVDSGMLIAILSPRQIWHPQVRFELICLGHLYAGITLIPVINQLYAILTFNKVNGNSPLNPDAVSWTLTHRDLLPLDTTPLWRERAVKGGER